MNRQFKRRVQREWDKIKIGKSCTNFILRNGLFTLPYVIYFQAAKISDDLMGVYYVCMFNFKDGYGYIELVAVCQFVSSLFRDLGSVKLGFVSEEEMEKGEEVQI